MKAGRQFFITTWNQLYNWSSLTFLPSSPISSSLMFHCLLQEQDSVEGWPRCHDFLPNLHRSYRKRRLDFWSQIQFWSVNQTSTVTHSVNPGWTLPSSALQPGLCPGCSGHSPCALQAQLPGAGLKHSPAQSRLLSSAGGKQLTSSLYATKSPLCLLVCFPHQQLCRNSWALKLPFPWDWKPSKPS